MVAIDQTVLRFSIFVSLFVLLALAERAWPRRAAQRDRRWTTNLGLLVLNTGLLRALSFAVPALPVVAAAFAAEQWRWGLLSLVQLPLGAAAVAGFVVLDLAVYAQHVAMHAVPVLWRLHRVHRSWCRCGRNASRWPATAAIAPPSKTAIASPPRSWR